MHSLQQEILGRFSQLGWSFVQMTALYRWHQGLGVCYSNLEYDWVHPELSMLGLSRRSVELVGGGHRAGRLEGPLWSLACLW